MAAHRRDEVVGQTGGTRGGFDIHGRRLVRCFAIGSIVDNGSEPLRSDFDKVLGFDLRRDGNGLRRRRVRGERPPEGDIARCTVAPVDRDAIDRAAADRVLARPEATREERSRARRAKADARSNLAKLGDSQSSQPGGNQWSR